MTKYNKLEIFQDGKPKDKQSKKQFNKDIKLKKKNREPFAYRMEYANGNEYFVRNKPMEEVDGVERKDLLKVFIKQKEKSNKNPLITENLQEFIEKELKTLKIPKIETFEGHLKNLASKCECGIYYWKNTKKRCKC